MATRVRTHCGLLATLFLCAATSVGAPGTTRALEPDAAGVDGLYRFAGGSQEVREVERAIDEAVEDMNVFIRGIARRRLKEPNLPTEELRITLDEDRITVARTGQPPISAPASGNPVTWRNPRNGNELRVTHRTTESGALEQVLVGNRGVSTNSFALTDDGRLEVRTTIEADLLPSTIRFTTTYAPK